MQELPMNIPEELSYKRIYCRASSRSWCKELLGRNLTGRPQDLFKDLHKIMHGLPRGFRQDLFKIFSQGPARTCRELYESLTIVMQKPSCCWRGSYKILMQEPPKSILEQLSYKHPKKQGIFQTFIARTSNIWHLQDLHARTFDMKDFNRSSQDLL